MLSVSQKERTYFKVLNGIHLNFLQNNNPKVFTKDGRPIVEFSIENRKVLNAREKRQQKSVEKNPLVKKTNVAKPPMVKPIKVKIKHFKVDFLNHSSLFL